MAERWSRTPGQRANDDKKIIVASGLSPVAGRATSQIQRWVRRREEDAAPGNRGSVGEEGPLLQQYNSAISFLQSVFEKVGEART